jgi:hypothetical protein
VRKKRARAPAHLCVLSAAPAVCGKLFAKKKIAFVNGCRRRKRFFF